MVGVLFFFERNDIDIFSGRRIDLSAWNYALKSAGDIDRVIIINRTEKQIPVFNSDLNIRIETKIPELSGIKTFVICPHDNAENKTDLWNFNHDTDWYLFGPADGWKSEDINIDNGVYIPTALSDGLHALHIATAVMLHRFRTKS